MTVAKQKIGVGRASTLIALLVVSVSVFVDDMARSDDAGPPIGEAISSVPIFDAHLHYKKEAWEPYPVATVIELMDKSGVAMALVSSTPDDGTIKLFEYAPKRIIPELRPYHNEFGSGNWTKAPGMIEYLKDRLKKFPHRGIGEFHIHTLAPSDRPFLKQVANLAMEHNILVHIHSGAEPVKLFFELEPSLTIIWAHAGMTESAEIVGKMMDRYPKLYADTSYRERDILDSRGGIDAAWRQVITKHADRYMVGSDTWTNSQWDNYEELIKTNREWLRHFPKAIAEKIAYGNAERLFQRKVARELVGVR